VGKNTINATKVTKHHSISTIEYYQPEHRYIPQILPPSTSRRKLRNTLASCVHVTRNLPSVSRCRCRQPSLHHVIRFQLCTTRFSSIVLGCPGGPVVGWNSSRAGGNYRLARKQSPPRPSRMAHRLARYLSIFIQEEVSGRGAHRSRGRLGDTLHFIRSEHVERSAGDGPGQDTCNRRASVGNRSLRSLP